MKISVIMASYLGEYPGCASNRELKFRRALTSFTNQTYEDRELIIVSDGCDISNNLYKEYFLNVPNIKYIQIPKQPVFSGKVRNIGLSYADGDIICYLDTDDFIDNDHLENIANSFENDKEVDMIYYDDYLVMNSSIDKFVKRRVSVEFGSIGTSAIAHRKFNDNIKWGGGYGHDYIFISSIITQGMSFKKIDNGKYFVCHWGDNKTGGDF